MTTAIWIGFAALSAAATGVARRVPALNRLLAGTLLALPAAAAVLGLAACLPPQDGERPAIAVDAKYPTARSAQSKLWYAADRWWTMLRDGDELSIWFRQGGRWRRQEPLDARFRSLAGRVDVWVQEHQLVAAIAGADRLGVVTMKYDSETDGYAVVGEPWTWAFDDSGFGDNNPRIEVVTIGRDSEGYFWLAYDLGSQIVARRSQDDTASGWSDAVDISGRIHYDDISVQFSSGDSLWIVWGDQYTQTVYAREHRAGRAFDEWQPVAQVATGNRTADDQLSAMVLADGRALLATKTGLDSVGSPLLSLRVKDVDGWRSLPYGPMTANEMPTRPAIVPGRDASCFYLVHGISPQVPGRVQQPDSVGDYIVYQAVDTDTFDLRTKPETVITAPDRVDLRAVTVTRQRLPALSELVVLASDVFGNVYEGIIPNSCNHHSRTDAVR